MTIELTCLLITAVLLTLLWIPYVVGLVKSGAELTPETYKSLQIVDEASVPDWVRRANRAHQNLVEQFGPFAAVVIIANLTGVSTTATTIAAGVFVIARLLHAIVMLGGYHVLQARTKTFFTAMICILVIAFEVARIAITTAV